MKKSNRRLQPLIWVTVLLLGQYAGQCFAVDVGDQSFESLSIVDTVGLSEMRAGDFDVNTTVTSIQELKATVTGGDFQAHSIVNGDIIFHDNAFDHFGGIGLVVGNTGNNNAIDAALGVSFHLE